MSKAQTGAAVRRGRGKERRRAGTRGAHDDSVQTRATPATASDTPAAVPDPLEFAVGLMRDATKSDALRASMCKAALPYVHGRWAPPASELEHAHRTLRLSALTGRDRTKEGRAALARVRRDAALGERLTRQSEAAEARRRAEEEAPRRPPPFDLPDPFNSLCVEWREAIEQAGLAPGSLARTAAPSADAKAPHAVERYAAAADAAPAPAVDARATELERRANAAEALVAIIKDQRPDIFDDSGAMRPLDADVGDLPRQLAAAQARADALERRATFAEGRIREAENRARDMAERACATEALIAGAQEWRRW